MDSAKSNNDAPLEVGAAIRRLRQRKRLTLEQLAAMLDTHRGSLSKVENAKQGYTGEFIRKVATALGVSEMDIYNEAAHGNTEEGPDIQGTVPLISWIQAGHWNEVVDNLHLGEGERIATTYRKRKHTYALRVRGDSMEPKFPEGAILIVEPEESPEPGAFVIVRQNGGEATFKQLMVDGATRYLKPLNPRYPIMELKADAVICGVVKRVEMDV